VRVVVITGKGLMHKYLCAQLAAKHEVVAILHPTEPRQLVTSKLRSIRRDYKSYGALALILRKLSAVTSPRLGWTRQHSVYRAERRFFLEAATVYRARLGHLARDVEDINGPTAVRLLSGLKADVVICLGGPVYRAPLIKATPLMLNYHTGISPIYNGAGTIFWTFANRHLHLAGGTLMIMNEVVDGGDILAHYLCPIAADDDPGDLFMKAVIGGTRLYDRFLQHLNSGGPYVSVQQPQPFFNYKGLDWTVFQSLSVQHNINRGLSRKFARPEEIVEYWRLANRQSARQLLKENMSSWICDA
jgi:Formyl transferase